MKLPIGRGLTGQFCAIIKKKLHVIPLKHTETNYVILYEIDGVDIQEELTSVKYLGIIFDSNLTLQNTSKHCLKMSKSVGVVCKISSYFLCRLYL